MVNFREFSDRRVVVTGGAGFIGSHTVDVLIANNAEVLVIDDLSAGKKVNLASVIKSKKLSFQQGSITHKSWTASVIKSFEPEFFVHLAALVDVQKSIQHPLLTDRINVGGTLQFLELARKFDAKRIVVASSAAVYGDLSGLPKREDMPTCPISPYGVSKLAAEAYLRAYYKAYGVPGVALRYFNVFGPRQTASFYSGVIAIFIGRVKQSLPPIIYGDGAQTRDFIFVKDVAIANTNALLARKAIGETFNIGRGEETSLNQLAAVIKEIAQFQSPSIYKEPRIGDITHSVADITRAKALLEWTPQYTISDGLKQTYEWYLKE